MRKRFDIWIWAGFFMAAVLGTLGHFAYDWSGKSLPVGAFCAVNESTWEHMKLLFFPVLVVMLALLAIGTGMTWASLDGKIPRSSGVGRIWGSAVDVCQSDCLSAFTDSGKMENTA